MKREDIITNYYQYDRDFDTSKDYFLSDRFYEVSEKKESALEYIQFQEHQETKAHKVVFNILYCNIEDISTDMIDDFMFLCTNEDYDTVKYIVRYRDNGTLTEIRHS